MIMLFDLYYVWSIISTDTVLCHLVMEFSAQINMLEVVSVLDPVKKNIVWFFERFEHEGHTCLAFEMLDRSLYQLITERHRNPLSLSEIRPIAEQVKTM